MRNLLFPSKLMAMLPASLLVPLLMLPGMAEAEIYKSIDENGNVVFSDQPSPGAEQIEKKEIPTVPSTVPEVDFSTDDESDEAAGDYSSIRIVNPENDTAVRENAGNLSVSVALEPALQSDHEIVLYMDGSEAARGRSPVFQFSNISRGEHTLTAAVMDDSGTEIMRSDSIRFTLLRESRLQPRAEIPGIPNAPSPNGPTPTNPPSGQPSGQNPVNPSFPGPTPTNPPKPSSSSP